MSAPRVAFAQPEARKVALYANVGADLTHYDVDIAGAVLTKRATVTLPAGVQYSWPHVSRRYLYVATSSSASGYGPAGTEHHVTAFRVDPASGALTKHGEAIRLPTRPIHMTTDIPSENILVAFNNPSALRVYRIHADFTPGEEVKQGGTIDAGIFAHQVRVTPDNRLAILVTRGNEGTVTKAEDPGALQGKKVFKGGENSIVVYSIDQSTGEPSPIQHIETRAIHPRTFHIDPSGRMLVAQHNLPVDVRDGDTVRTIPAGLSVFRIGDDGKLTFVRKYDVDVGGKTMFWMGMVQL
jgi:6-phosphogluconolactonase (cycloisomerase 2 family)